MNRDEHGQVVLNEDDLFDLVMKGRSYLSFGNCVVDDSVNAQLFGCEQYVPSSISTAQYDLQNQQEWFMPQSYYDIDIVQLLIDRCKNDVELTRCGEELIAFQERGLFNLLKYLVYLVDTMRTNNVIWGVGRGSSVSSFVLYLIGIHRVNPIESELLFEDFLR